MPALVIIKSRGLSVLRRGIADMPKAVKKGSARVIKLLREGRMGNRIMQFACAPRLSSVRAHWIELRTVADHSRRLRRLGRLGRKPQREPRTFLFAAVQSNRA